jgi:hypothetical protein
VFSIEGKCLAKKNTVNPNFRFFSKRKSISEALDKKYVSAKGKFISNLFDEDYVKENTGFWIILPKNHFTESFDQTPSDRMPFDRKHI